MNLILLEEGDFLAQGRVRLEGRRFEHICGVLAAGAGDALKVGALNGKIGTGSVVRRTESSVEMDVELYQEPPAPLPVTVVLALPRPKVMRRILYTLAVLGVKKILLINAARVEKSYWQTPFLQPPAVRRQLLLGLEQAGDTLVPEVHLRSRFRPFVEDELPALSNGTLGLVAHPAATDECPRAVGSQVTLAIGPEGGFVPFEIGLLWTCGLTPIRMGPRVLNVETAVTVLLSQLLICAG